MILLFGIFLAACGPASTPTTDTSGTSAATSNDSDNADTSDTNTNSGDVKPAPPKDPPSPQPRPSLNTPPPSAPPQDPYAPPPPLILDPAPAPIILPVDPYTPPPPAPTPAPVPDPLPPPPPPPDPLPDSKPEPTPDPKPDPAPAPLKACGAYPMGVAALPALPTTICGNGTKETGEACDDGNTVGNDSCSADCSKVFVGTAKPQVCAAVASPVITVTDSNGTALSGATVTLYADTAANNAPLHTRFPQTQLPAEQLLAVGKTNAQGEWTIPAAILIHSDNYIAVATKPGYLGQFTASLTCGSFTKSTVATLSLQSLAGYAATPSTADSSFYAARVDTFHYSYFEREDRQIIFPYVPSVRSSLCATLDTVDVTLHIVGAPLPDGFAPQGILPEDIDLAYHQTVTQKSVQLFKLNAFRFSTPTGVYYFYFEFTLHHSGKPAETVMFYPERAGYGTYPKIVPGPTSLNSFFYTFDSSLLVYPADTLATFAETKAAQLTQLTGTSTGNRIPIILMNSGFDPAEFLALATRMVKGTALAMETVAPFSSNKDRFAIFASSSNWTAADAKWPLSNNWGVVSGSVPLTKSQKLYMNATVGPKPLLFLLTKDPTISFGTKAGSGFCEFENGTSISISSADYTACMAANGGKAEACADYFDLSRVFLHELGHELGILGEEYYEIKDSFFDVNNYEAQTGHYFTPYYKPNTAFPAGLDLARRCYQTRFSYGSAPASSVLCSDLTTSDFCKKVPWHDLLGAGDTGCYLGGGPDTGRSRVNLMKPHPHSIMDFGGNFNSVPISEYNGHVYGIANERSLCQAIQAYTESASSDCKKLCMQGCAAGQKCDLNGNCVTAGVTP